MARKKNTVVARTSSELADILNLEPSDTVEMEFRAVLNHKIIEAVKKKGITHAEIAKRAKTSRTRVTAILNGNTRGISSDLMLRILYALGYKTTVKFAPIKMAA